MLLLTGPPGCGKSVLTRYVADYLPRVAPPSADNQYNVISYFCSYAEAASDTEAMLLRSLLHQLVRLKPESGSIVLNKLQKTAGNEQDLYLTAKMLWDALFEALAMLSTTHICLVLDAIEELGDFTAKSVLKNLSRLTKYLDAVQPRSRLKLFISSRRSYSGTKVGCEILRMERHQMDADIKAYLDHAIQEFAERNSSFAESTSRSLRYEISDTIAKSCNSTFLVAVLSWENFRTGQTHWSPKLVRKRLSSVMPLKSDIEDFYDSILSKGDDDAIAAAEMIFSIVGAAARPLTEAELQELAGMCRAGRHVRSSADFSPIRHVVQIMDERYPGLMAIQNNGRVTLIHRSFKDYLESDRLNQIIRMETRYLVRACLQYLQLGDLIQDAKSGLTRYGSFQYLIL